MIIFQIAWRNVWRNTKRSVTVALAIAFGLWGGVVASGVFFGLTRDSVSGAVDTRLSHLQIHKKGFSDGRNFRDSVADTAPLMARLRSLPAVSAAAGRSVCEGMASSTITAQGVTIYGVDPDEERNATAIAEKVTLGSYFAGSVHNPVLVGEGLAETLQLRINSKVVLTMQDSSGNLVAGAFRVEGMFRTVSASFDKSSVFVLRRDLAQLLGTPERIHEIAVRLRSPEQLDSVVSLVRSFTPGDTVESWRQLAPELDYINEYTGVYLNAFLYIILTALLFGLMNTMLMSVLDRVREFGILQAVGMRGRYMFAMIMMESVFLSLSGAVAGIAAGAATVAFFAHQGIDLTRFGEGLRTYGYTDLFFPAVPLWIYRQVAVSVIVTAVVASLYPAWRAIRLHPAQAIRTY